MESALRRYSVLSVDATTLVEYANQRFYLRVVELKPATVVSFCGDVDLETDFMAPEHSNLKRPRSQEERSRSQHQQQNDDVAEGPSDELQADASLTESSVTTDTSTDRRHQSINSPVLSATNIAYRSPIPDDDANLPGVGPHRQPAQRYSLQQAQQRVRERQEAKSISTSAIAALAPEDSTAMHLRRAQLAFNSVGHRLVDTTGSRDAQNESMSKEKQPSTTTTALQADTSNIPRSKVTETPPTQASECPLCLAQIPDAARELHAVRCARNPAYHKVKQAFCCVIGEDVD